jgi:hypothetical protein
MKIKMLPNWGKKLGFLVLLHVFLFLGILILWMDLQGNHIIQESMKI